MTVCSYADLDNPDQLVELGALPRPGAPPRPAAPRPMPRPAACLAAKQAAPKSAARPGLPSATTRALATRAAPKVAVRPGAKTPAKRVPKPRPARLGVKPAPPGLPHPAKAIPRPTLPKAALATTAKRSGRSALPKQPGKVPPRGAGLPPRVGVKPVAAPKTTAKRPAAPGVRPVAPKPGMRPTPAVTARPALPPGLPPAAAKAAAATPSLPAAVQPAHVMPAPAAGRTWMPPGAVKTAVPTKLAPGAKFAPQQLRARDPEDVWMSHVDDEDASLLRYLLDEERKLQGRAAPPPVRAVALHGFGAVSVTDAPVTIGRQVNALLVKVLGPLYPVTDKLPSPSYYPQFGADMHTAPVEALLGLMSPVEDFIRDACKKAFRYAPRSIHVGFPGYFPQDVKMNLDISTRGMDKVQSEYIRRLRLAEIALILATREPVALARGVAEQLVSMGPAGIEAATGIVKQVQSAGSRAPKFVTSLLDAIKSKFPAMPDPEEVKRKAEQAAREAAAKAQEAKDAAEREAREAAEASRRAAEEAAGNARRDAEAKLDDLKKKLKKAKKATPPNPGKIASLVRDVANAERDLSNLHGYAGMGALGSVEQALEEFVKVAAAAIITSPVTVPLLAMIVTRACRAAKEGKPLVVEDAAMAGLPMLPLLAAGVAAAAAAAYFATRASPEEQGSTYQRPGEGGGAGGGAGPGGGSKPGGGGSAGDQAGKVGQQALKGGIQALSSDEFQKLMAAGVKIAVTAAAASAGSSAGTSPASSGGAGEADAE